MSRSEESDHSVDLKACFALVKKAMMNPQSKKRILKKKAEPTTEATSRLGQSKISEPSQILKSKKKIETSTISNSNFGLLSPNPITQKLLAKIRKDGILKMEKPQPVRESIFKISPQLKKHKLVGELREPKTRPISPPVHTEKSKSKDPKKPKIKQKTSLPTKKLGIPKKSGRVSSPKLTIGSAVTPSQPSKNLLVVNKSNIKSAGRPRKLQSTDEHESRDNLENRRIYNSKEKTKKKNARSVSSSEERPTKEHSKVKLLVEASRSSKPKPVKLEESFDEPEPVRVNSKDEIYKKFAEIAAESERKLLEFLRAAEPLSSSVESGASVLNEYKRRAQHCIGVLRQPIVPTITKQQVVPKLEIPHRESHAQRVNQPEMEQTQLQTVTSFLNVATLQQVSTSELARKSKQVGEQSRLKNQEAVCHSRSSLGDQVQDSPYLSHRLEESPRVIVLSPRLNVPPAGSPTSRSQPVCFVRGESSPCQDKEAFSSQVIISTSSVPLGIEPLELLKQKASYFQENFHRKKERRSLPESPNTSVNIQLSPSKVQVIANTRRVVDEPFPVTTSPVCHTPRQPTWGAIGIPELYTSKALHQSIEKKSRRSSCDAQGDTWKQAVSLQASPQILRPVPTHFPSPKDADSILVQNSMEIIQADDLPDAPPAETDNQEMLSPIGLGQMASPASRLNIHSHTSKSLHIKDLGSGDHPQFGERSYPDLVYIANNLVEPFALAAKESPVRSSVEGKDSDEHSDLAVDIVDQALADSSQHNKSNAVDTPADQEDKPGSDQMFATPEEKSDIITSFILENLIIEALSEDFCLNKFLTVLGPHQKHLELSGYSSYLDRLFENVKRASSGHESVARKLNTPIGHSDLQRLLLATPTLGEQDQETLAAFEYEPVLDIRLYISLEEELREGEYERRGMDGFEMEREHILHKMLFDALNECLDYRRKGGVGGQPLKFLRKGKEEPDRIVDDVSPELEAAKREVLQWAAMRAGTMIAKEPQLSYHSNTQGLDKLREKAMLLQIKEYVDPRMT